MKKTIFILLTALALSNQSSVVGACRGTSDVEDGPYRHMHGWSWDYWHEYEWFRDGEKYNYGGCCGGSPLGGTGIEAIYSWSWCWDDNTGNYVCQQSVSYQTQSVTYCQEQACWHMLEQ